MAQKLKKNWHNVAIQFNEIFFDESPWVVNHLKTIVNDFICFIFQSLSKTIVLFSEKNDHFKNDPLVLNF